MRASLCARIGAAALLLLAAPFASHASPSAILRDSAWLHQSRASPSQLVSLTFGLHHGSSRGIDSLFTAVSDPKSASYLQYPSEAELVALANPPAPVLARLEEWLQSDVCGSSSAAARSSSSSSSCSFSYASQFKDSLKLQMSVAAMESFLGSELHVYQHARKTGVRCVRSSLSSLSHVIPAELQPHVAYVQGLASWPADMRATGVRSSGQGTLGVYEEEVYQPSVTKPKTLFTPSSSSSSKRLVVASAEAAAASAALARRLESSMSARNSASRAAGLSDSSVSDSNFLAVSQVSTGDLQLDISMALFSSLDPLVLCQVANDEVACGPQGNLLWEYSTITLTNANGVAETFQITQAQVGANGVPSFGVAVQLNENFAGYTLKVTQFFTGQQSFTASYPFPLSGMPQLGPALLKSLYNVPDRLNATDSRVTKLGIGSLQVPGDGGFYDPNDVALFWKHNNLTGTPNTTWVDFSSPTLVNNATLPSGETSLDIQFGLGLVGSPTVLGEIYHIGLTTNTPFIDIMNGVLSDPHPPSVLSFSYGDNEAGNALDYIGHANTQFKITGLRGVSIMVSSGDTGAYMFQGSQSATCSQFLPSWPATSPYITSVGASTLKSDGVGQCPYQVQCSLEFGTIITGGGGFSNLNAQPPYQQAAVSSWLNSAECQLVAPMLNSYNTSNRAYPDIVLFGHNYGVYISGVLSSLDGTSASSPSFAGIMTLYSDLRNRKGLPRLGFLNPLLYHAAAANPAAFRDVTQGSNRCLESGMGCCTDGYHACRGFDPVSGLGAPDFSVLQSFFNVTAPDATVTLPKFLLECGPPESSSSSKLVVIIVAAVCGGAVLIGFAIWCIKRKKAATPGADRHTQNGAYGRMG